MVAARIKEYLKRNGIKGSFLADKIGVPRNTISSILNGKRKITAEEYFQICKALRVSTDFFFENKDWDA